MNILKKPSYFILGIIIFFCVMTVTGLYIKFVSNYEPKITLVYAKKDIPERTLITTDMIEERQMSISSNHKYAIKSINELVGKKAVVNITTDELILSTRVVSPEKANDITLNNQENRLYTLEFKPDQANGWQLQEDSYVDLIFVPNPSQKQNIAPISSSSSYNNTSPQQQAQSTVTATNFDESQIVRLSKIRIAGIVGENNKIINTTAKTSDSAPKYITFEVTTKQDIFLCWAKTNGRVEISLSNNSEGK